jgi:hypothetical protein
MSNQAAVQSIDLLKELRVAMALFSEEALAALGAVEMEIRRTALWLQQDRRIYWHDQIKRRQEKVAQARAEVARRRLQKTAEYTPAMSEQKEILRKAEASLQDAELRASLVKKWEPALQQAILEYHGSIRRIKDFAAGDALRATVVLERMIDALEAYIQIAVPAGPAEKSAIEIVGDRIMDVDDQEVAALENAKKPNEPIAANESLADEASTPGAETPGADD